MAFGFLGRRRRGPRRDRGGMTAPPGARLPNERDPQQEQRRPVEPTDKLKRAVRDPEAGRDTEARWQATGELADNTRPATEKPSRPVIIRKRMRI